MSGISILRNLLLKEAVKGSGQASGIMSIGDSVRKLAEKRLQSYLLSAQKQGVDLDKLGEQEIKYMLELNKKPNYRVISQDDPEFVSFRDQILGKKNRDNVIQGKFGKPFKEEIGSVDNIINNITRMEPVAALKEVNKVLRREGKYKNLSKQDSEKVFNDTNDWINQRDQSDLYDYKNKRPFREDPNFDPDDPDFDPENFADGGRTGYYLGSMVGRARQQKDGIESRLEKLGGDVTSAEQMLQGINKRLETAGSSVPEGSGASIANYTPQLPVDFKYGEGPAGGLGNLDEQKKSIDIPKNFNFFTANNMFKKSIEDQTTGQFEIENFHQLDPPNELIPALPINSQQNLQNALPGLFADGGVAGLLGERTGFRGGGAYRGGGSRKSKSKSKSYSAPRGGGADMGTVSTPTRKANPNLVARAEAEQKQADQTNRRIAANRAAAKYELKQPKTKKGVLNYLDSVVKYTAPFVDPRKKPGQIIQLYKFLRDPLLGGMGNKIGYDQKNFILGEDSSNIAYDERLGYVDLNTGQPINMTMPGATQVGLNLPQTEYLDKLAKMPKAVGESGFLEYKSPKTVKEGIQQLNPESESLGWTGYKFNPDKITYGDPKTFATDQDVISYMKEKHGLTPTGSAAGTGIIGLDLADGGPARQNFAMGRRAFLKLLGVGGAGIAGLKTGVGLGGKKVATEVAKDVATTSGPPPYFFNLVNKIKTLGDDTLASKDKAIAKKYKDYTMEEDFAGNIEIIKKGGDDMFPENVYMSYKVDEVPLKGRGKKGSTKVEEYEEYTARPDIDGKMKDVEGGVPDEVIEEGTIFEDNMTDFGKADGGIARMLGE